MPFFPNGCRALLDGWRLRILLTQGTTTDSDDLPLFIARRADLRKVLSRLQGGIGT